MGIRYINADPNLNFTRPTGFVYPVGLTALEQSRSIEYLVIAGGGGGGYDRGGGGGAGGYVCGVSGENTGGGQPAQPAASLGTGQNYRITIGAGGPGTGAPTSSRGANGSWSFINTSSNVVTVSAVGGGGGGSQQVTGHPGGSGGGHGSQQTGPAASGTPSQGYSGGIGNPVEAGTYLRQGGGGGGAGGSGITGGPSTASAGGVGVASSITGTPVFRGGGGAGAQSIAPVSPFTNLSGPVVPGGNGGGGATNTNGTVNTGGGGGGAADAPAYGNGGTGGSGTVIIRYTGSQAATGGTVSPSVPGYTIHTFTGDGWFNVNSSITYAIN